MAKNDENNESITTHRASTSGSQRATLELLKKIYLTVQSHSRTVDHLSEAGKESNALSLTAIAEVERIKRDLDECKRDLDSIFDIVVHEKDSHSVRISVIEEKFKAMDKVENKQEKVEERTFTKKNLWIGIFGGALIAFLFWLIQKVIEQIWK